jgi:uncharacterized protein YabE (DUF348 family)
MRKLFKRSKQTSDVVKAERPSRFHRVRRHPAFAIPFITLSLLGFLTLAVIFAISGGKPQLKSSDVHVVIVNHDKQEQTIPTRARTVGEVLERANIAVHEGDVVEPDRSTEVVSDNFRINVYRAVPVTIVDGGRKTFTFSAASTPRSIVKQAGIEVYPEDRLLLLPAENFLLEGSIGERVVIERATPVNLNIYGTQVTLRTLAKTVGELLEERKITMKTGDTVQPTQGVGIAANMQIFLLRKGVKIETVDEVVPMPVQVVEDESLSFGTVVTRQQGAPGRKLITYQIDTTKNERKVIQEVVTTQPVAQITARGKAVQIPSDKQAVMAAAGIASSDYPYVDFIMSHESGWCPTKLQGQIGYCPPYAPEHIPSGLGYGIGQATPGTKMAPYGADWKTSPVTQLRWSIAYVKGRYGSWAAAYNYWQGHKNW